MAYKSNLQDYMIKTMGRKHNNTITLIISIMNSFTYHEGRLSFGDKTKKDKSYLIGGAVRDLMSNEIPRDFDFATSASPDKIERILGTRKWGKAKISNIRSYFKLMDKNGEKIEEINETSLYKQFENLDSYELESFRPMVTAEVYDEVTKESWTLEFASYHINMNPIINKSGEITTSCLMVKTIEEHLSNLDFTVNSIAMETSGDIIDLFQGQKDVETKTLRAIIPTKERFEEQPRTMLRAIKLLVSSGYKLEPKTKKALKDAKFEIHNKMRPINKKTLISEILTYPGGIQLLSKYGISSKIWKDFGSVLKVGGMSNMNKGFNNLIKYTKPSSKSKIDISKEASIILLHYYISKSFDEIDDKSIIKTAKKYKISPEISKVIHKYTVFNNSPQAEKEYIYFFRAIEIYLNAKTYSDIYKVKKELDNLISNSKILPQTLLKCFNIVITIIALDNKKELTKIKQTNKFLYTLYSTEYQRLLKYKDKAVKHVYSYYETTEERAEEIIEDLIVGTLIDKDKPKNWEYILTNAINHKKYNLSFRGNIKHLVGTVKEPINYSLKMESNIHQFLAKDKIENIGDGFVSDSLKVIEWHTDFIDETDDWNDDDQDEVDFYRKLLNLIIFQWKYAIIPADKERQMNLWVNSWFAYTLDAMLFNDSEFVSGNRDIKRYNNAILNNLNDKEIKEVKELKNTYNVYMNSAYKLWEEGNTTAVNTDLNKARKMTIDIFKDKEAYTSFFQDKIIIDYENKKLSELSENFGKPVELDFCPFCSGAIMYWQDKGSKDYSARCITEGCYKDIPSYENLNYQDIDWFIFNDNNYVHTPVSFDITKRLQLSLDLDQRKTLRLCKNEYNDVMFKCHKEFCKIFNIFDVNDPNYDKMLNLSSLIYKIRRKMMDLIVKRIRKELIRYKVFKEDNFINPIGSIDAIDEYSFIYDWISYNTEDSYKLTKIDVLRAILNSQMKYNKKRKQFLTIQKDYYDIVQNNKKKKNLYGNYYNDISLIYFKILNKSNLDYNFKDSKIWKTNKHIRKFLNNDLWFDEYFIGNIIPIFYPKRNWFDLEKIIKNGDEENIIILNELSTCIYSILQIHNPESWGHVALIYNQLPIDKMEFGLLTANMAKYIYEKCIQPYENKV